MHLINQVTTPEQISSVAILAEEIWNQHFPPIIGQAQVDYMVSKFQSVTAITEQIQTEVQYYVLNLDGISAGYIALIPESDLGRMMLSKLYLKQSARGCGLGKEMLTFARDQCLFQGCSTLWLTVNRDNNATVQWYLRQGLKIIDKIDKDIGSGFVMNDFVMEFPVG